MDEVLGSGDGTLGNQKFVLQKPPLTYISAATSSGSETTLEVRVNNIVWEEVRSLYGLDDRRQAYIVRIDDNGNTNQDLRGEVYFAPLAPQFWGVMMSKSPRIGGFRGQMRKS
ncbi:hypothetical protein BJP37_04475 [Moorena bouillonii PNG]|uniref:Uncharacterized protein n=1 Tax=Moorena bouillonii PNG TaxID=568701 RepID=A0A1U7MXI2_9CYAN|nr:hypothetical protein BJP37_04475 [Moorena bouillonii PNG]